jgi:uncharacterized protein YdgA (DUF945 family)
MKKIIGIVGTVGVLVVGAYYGAGWLTERAFQKTIHDVQVTKGVDVSVVQYNRGLFHSTAMVEWVLHIPAQHNTLQNGQVQTVEATDYVIPVNLSIAHGPVMIGADGVHIGLGYARTQLNIPEKYRNQIYTYFNASSTTLPKLKLSLLINFMNQAKIALNVPEFHLSMISNEGQFVWSGLTSSSVLSLNLSKMKGQAQLKRAQFNKGPMSMDLEKVSSDYDIRRTALGLYDGTAHFQLNALKIVAQGKTQFGMNQFSISTENIEKSSLFDSHLQAKLESVIVEGQNYGPGVIEMSLTNLDAQVLAKVNHQLQSMNQLSLIARQKVLISLLPELPQLFSKGASFNISQLSFGMPEGELKGELMVTLPKDSTTNPFQIFSHVIGSGHVKVPAKVVRDVMENAVRQKLMQPSTLQPNQPQTTGTPQPIVLAQGSNIEQEVKNMTDKRLSSLVESGALVQQGQDYTLDVKLEHGKVVVNGKPFVPAMLEF